MPYRSLLLKPLECRTPFFLTFRRLAALSSPGLPKPPMLHELVDEQDMGEAKKWVTSFSEPSNGKISKELVELSFSRSSGPGGQNVNKVNTKATARCSVNAWWIPKWSLPALVKDPHYAASTHSIVVTSSVHRSQSQNIEECLSKLHSLVLSAATVFVKTSPSEGQKKKVDALKAADNARRKTEKLKRSSVKQLRSGKGGGFDF